MSQLHEKREPLEPLGLVGPQHGAKTRARPLRMGRGIAKTPQRLFQPSSGDDLGEGSVARTLVRPPSMRSPSANERLSKARRIDLAPPPTKKLEPSGPLQDPSSLLGRERLAVEREVDISVESLGLPHERVRFIDGPRDRMEDLAR